MKTIFITGATAGFGLAIAKKFAAQKATLILTGRRKERFEAIKTELSQLGAQDIHWLCFDVRDEKETINAINSLQKPLLNQLNILINNAGLAVGKATIDQGLTEDWDRMIDTNVKGLLYVTKTLLPYLKQNKNTQIVNIGSIAGKEVYPGGNVYCASKHAVDALSKAMRIDLLPHKIKVSNIAPGAANTEFSTVRFKGDEDLAQKVYSNYNPLLAQDIADAVSFVCSRPAHVTINDLTIMPTAQASAAIIDNKT